MSGRLKRNAHHSLPERYFIQIEMDDGWSTFDIVEYREHRAALLAEAIRTVLEEHPIIGIHPLRVVTTSQLGKREDVMLAEIRGQEEWVPEQVAMVRSHAVQLVYGNPLSMQMRVGAVHTPVRIALRAFANCVERLEDAIRRDPRAMRIVAEEAGLKPDTVRRIRNGDTLYASLVVTDTSLLPKSTLWDRKQQRGEIDAQDTNPARG